MWNRRSSRAGCNRLGRLHERAPDRLSSSLLRAALPPLRRKNDIAVFLARVAIEHKTAEGLSGLILDGVPLEETRQGVDTSVLSWGACLAGSNWNCFVAVIASAAVISTFTEHHWLVQIVSDNINRPVAIVSRVKATRGFDYRVRAATPESEHAGPD